MARIKAKFDYDPEIDSLYVYAPHTEGARVASVSAGEYFTLDIQIGKNDALGFKGIEILDVSKWLPLGQGVKATPKEVLKHLTSAEVGVEVGPDYIFLVLFVRARVRGELISARQPIPIPLQTH